MTKAPIPAVLLCAALAGCGNDEAPSSGEQANEPAKPVAPIASMPPAQTPAARGPGGNFTATLGDTDYNVAVECSYFDKSYFTFKSDKTDTTDSNGDGLIISGMQNGSKMSLTLIDHDRKWSTGRMQSFAKGQTTAEGAGQLSLDGSTESKRVHFEVTCP